MLFNSFHIEVNQQPEEDSDTAPAEGNYDVLNNNSPGKYNNLRAFAFQFYHFN